MLAHPAAEIDKGAGIAMCCTFGDLTDVLWWRELRLPTRSVITRSGRLQREVPEWLARYGPASTSTTTSSPARPPSAPARPSSRRCARAATSRASRPRPSGWPTSTSAARSRSRSSPRASGTSATAAATPTSTPRSSRAARRSTSTPPFMRTPLRELGQRPQRRLARLAPALLRRADPGLVPARRRRRARLRRARIVPAEADLPGRPRGQPAGRLHRGPARRARRLRRRPRHLRHLGHLVADPADRRRLARRRGHGHRPAVREGLPDGRARRRATTSSAPGCSRPSCARTSSTARCRGPTPRSAAGSSTPTARR